MQWNIRQTERVAELLDPNQVRGSGENPVGASLLAKT